MTDLGKLRNAIVVDLLNGGKVMLRIEDICEVLDLPTKGDSPERRVIYTVLGNCYVTAESWANLMTWLLKP